jgi:hypothetical protein
VTAGRDTVVPPNSHHSRHNAIAALFLVLYTAPVATRSAKAAATGPAPQRLGGAAWAGFDAEHYGNRKADLRANLQGGKTLSRQSRNQTGGR